MVASMPFILSSQTANLFLAQDKKPTWKTIAPTCQNLLLISNTFLQSTPFESPTLRLSIFFDNWVSANFDSFYWVQKISFFPSLLQDKLNNSCSRAAAKAVKRNPNLGMKMVASHIDFVKNPSLGMGNIVVQDTSLTSSNQKIESCGNTTSPTQTEEGMKKGIARSTLYEICAANRWKPPIFECCKEEGPSHKRMFTFKVIIEIEASRNTIECYGAPHRKKKAAADHAAEGALLYLKYMGCVMKNQQIKSR